MSSSPELADSALLSPSAPAAPHCEQGLLGLANATRVLLRHSNLSVAFPRALEHLRASIQIDRLYLCEQRGDEFHLKFEALGHLLTSRLEHPAWQAQSYRRLGLTCWASAFSQRRSVGGLGQYFSPAEQHFLGLEGEQFAWLTPVYLPEGDLWGFLGCEHHTLPAYFSSCEQPLLLSLADNLGYAVGRQRGEQQMQHRAFHDLLTGLPNRMLFNDRLPVAIAHARRTQEAVAVMFLDLDKFKRINDSLGHDYGDALLVQATQRLKSCLREEDILARWGGDEFTLCLPNLQSSDAVVKICQRLLAELRRPFEINQEILKISGSIGIALYPQDGQDIDSLLRHADTALYRVKQNGRDHYQFFQSEMNSLVVEQLAWAKRLQKALQISQPSLPRMSQEFEVYYQPLLRWEAGQMRVYALEALLRWRHPDHGLLTAAEFFPYAEQAGIMVPLGHWVLESVSAHRSHWNRMGLPLEFVAINLSKQQFQSSVLMAQVVQVTQATQVEQTSRSRAGEDCLAQTSIAIAAELDEATLCLDLDYTQSVLTELRTAGVQVVLQQFGRGQLGIEPLVRLPLSRLKLSPHLLRGWSPEFLNALGKDALDKDALDKDAPNDTLDREQVLEQQRGKQAIAALFAFAQQLSLPVVAQAVEFESQWELLRSLHCTEAQGYFFGPPMSAAEITTMLQTQSQRQNQP